MDIFWKKNGWEKEDTHLAALEKMPFKRSFPFIPDKNGIYIIRGPRQIGKSSWLKTILKHYSKIDSNNIFYLSCENLRDHLDLSELLKSIRKKRIILLDEITFVKEWARAIKHEADSGYFDIVIITGSNAVDLRRGGERMPGRLGSGGNFSLLPMEFEEFSLMRKKAGFQSLTRERELEIYFKTGGFPIAVAESHSSPEFNKEKSIKVYEDWIIGDFLRLGKQEIYLKELFIALCTSSTTPISLQKLAQKTQIGSHHTVMEYISTLEDCFIIRTLYAIDIDTGNYRYKKEKKFYFTDPIFYWIGLDFGKVQNPGDYEDKIAEMVANEAIARRCNRYGYLSTSIGEIDFFCKDKWAIEVKWSDKRHNLSLLWKKLQGLEKILWIKDNYLKQFPAILAAAD